VSWIVEFTFGILSGHPVFSAANDEAHLRAAPTKFQIINILTWPPVGCSRLLTSHQQSVLRQEVQASLNVID
jgi:hypothetical protein